MSERTFRRWRDRHDEHGLDGLFDRRLDKASAKRVPLDEITWVLEQYRTVYRSWTVKHFHDHLRKHHGFGWSYTWTKTQLQAAGLVLKALRRGAHRRKRARRPLVGMMLHQDGSTHQWLEGREPLDLVVTLDDASSGIYSAFLVEQEGTASSCAGLLEVVACKGLFCALYRDRGSQLLSHQWAGGADEPHHQRRDGEAIALPQLRSARPPSRRRLGCLQLCPSLEDAQRAHAPRIHLQNLDIRAGSIHPESDPPHAGTEHLEHFR